MCGIVGGSKDSCHERPLQRMPHQMVKAETLGPSGCDLRDGRLCQAEDSFRNMDIVRNGEEFERHSYR